MTPAVPAYAIREQTGEPLKLRRRPDTVAATLPQIPRQRQRQMTDDLEPVRRLPRGHGPKGHEDKTRRVLDDAWCAPGVPLEGVETL